MHDEGDGYGCGTGMRATYGDGTGMGDSYGYSSIGDGSGSSRGLLFYISGTL
jgi:hypothetical protein